jgi:hypothetical protein
MLPVVTEKVVPFLDPEAALAYLRGASIDLVVTDLRASEPIRSWEQDSCMAEAA